MFFVCSHCEMRCKWNAWPQTPQTTGAPSPAHGARRAALKGELAMPHTSPSTSSPQVQRATACQWRMFTLRGMASSACRRDYVSLFRTLAAATARLCCALTSLFFELARAPQLLQMCGRAVGTRMMRAD